MTQLYEEIQTPAAKLSKKEQRALAGFLLANVDADPSDEIERTWDDELSKRV